MVGKLLEVLCSATSTCHYKELQDEEGLLKCAVSEYQDGDGKHGLFKMLLYFSDYCQISRMNQIPNFDVSRLILQLYLPNPLKPAVKSRMKM